MGSVSVKRPNGQLSYQCRSRQTEETGELNGVPIDYDLYVDGSISMVNCSITTSFLEISA